MTDKPATAAGYGRGHVELVRATCLYAATRLGDIMDDLVIVGGLVPSLLVDQSTLPEDKDAHAGTMDLDVGLSLALLDEKRYRTMTESLRRADFEPDVSKDGKMTRQRWKIEGPEKITVDFLMQPDRPEDRGGRLKNIESDFAVVITPGLHLAFRDRERIPLSGSTIRGERATRHVWVCGPGAYVVLKALAFHQRGDKKDAYDLYYIVRNYGAGVDDVASRLGPLLEDPFAKDAVEILRNDFQEHDGLGPRRVAEFIRGAADDEIQADVVGFIGRLLAQCIGRP